MRRLLKAVSAVFARLAVALGLLVLAAELRLADGEAYSLSVAGREVGVGPWLRGGGGGGGGGVRPFAQRETAQVEVTNGECCAVTFERRAWLVWTRW